MNDGVGLGGAYDATLQRIKAQDGEKAKLAMATLMWVCHSERPLLVDELCHALAVEIGSEDFDSDNVPLIATLLSCCQGLITVDKEALTVRLIHHTLQEYLSAYPDLFVMAHSTIAETCLTYLNSRLVKKFPPYPLPDHQCLPFLKYSSRYWGTHTKREFSDGLMSLVLELLSPYDTHISAMSLLQQFRSGSNFDEDLDGLDGSSLFTGLHCASFFGLVVLVTTLMDNKACEINQRDCTGATPLLWAAENGHEEVVMLILDQENSSPDEPDKQGRTPLWHAASGGHDGVVRLLLEQGDVFADSQSKGGITPLQRATVRGHKGVVRLLAEFQDINPNLADTKGRTALWSAAALGKDEVLKILLERKDVDPNFPNNNGLTPLQMAVAHGEEGTLTILLGRDDINPNYPDDEGQTPLMMAVALGQEGSLKMLLERRDIDPNYRDTKGRTALWWAAVLEKDEVLKILLERNDIDPNCPNNNGITPLQVADEEGVKLFLERKKIDANCLENEGQVSPFSATATQHEAALKLLPERKDADPNRHDNAN